MIVRWVAFARGAPFVISSRFFRTNAAEEGS